MPDIPCWFTTWLAATNLAITVLGVSCSWERWYCASALDFFLAVSSTLGRGYR